MNLEYRGTKLDVHSQRILRALADGPARASQLAEQAGLDDPQSVRYRINNYLQPANLVAEVGTGTVNGGEAVYYGLTESGETAVDIAPEGFGEPRDLHEMRRELQSLREQVETLSGRLEMESDRIDNRATRQTLQRTQTRLDDALETVEMQAEWASKSAHQASEAKQEIEEYQTTLDVDIDRLEATVATQAERLDEVDSAIAQAEREREELNSRVRALESVENESSSWRFWQS